MKNNMHQIKMMLVVVSLLIMFVNTAFAEYTQVEEQNDMIKFPIAIVNVKKGSWLNVRKTPNGELTYTRLYPWYDVIILEQKDGWALVTTQNWLEEGREPPGWASMEYLVIYRFYFMKNNVSEDWSEYYEGI